MNMLYAKPFVKWAGGKARLLNEIDRVLPNDFGNSNYVYIEPFVGGGAVLFWILQKYPNLKKVVINDINSDLINAFLVIKESVKELISVLKQWEKEYHLLSNDKTKKKLFYYNKRKLFNLRQSDKITQAALFIFLNRTCFNGLYRVNRKNEFNVPIGNYNKPTICDEKNLIAVNRLLQKVLILNGDFEETLNYAEGNTLFYLDPPYKPLNETSNFTSYTEKQFDDNEQIRLAEFCKQLDKLGYKWILSNSDMKNSNPNNDFFEKLYENFNIKRVRAKRYINSNPNKRGELTELLITNFINPNNLGKEICNGETTSIQITAATQR